MVVSREERKNMAMLLLLSTGRIPAIACSTLLGLVLLMHTAPVLAQGFSADLAGHEHIAIPGDVIEGTLRVSSMSDEPITLEVTTGDYVRELAGSETKGSYSFVNELGMEERSATAWISYAPEILDLAPGENAEVRYQIRVPADAALRGSYWGVLFVQPTASEEDLRMDVEDDAETPSVGIFVRFRYAIRIYVTIGNDPPAKPQFVGLEAEPLNDGLQVMPSLRNDGKVFVRPELTVQLRDLTGDVVFQTDSIPCTILPESICRTNIEVRPLYLPDGEYLMVVIGDTGDPQMIAAQSQVTLTGMPAEPPPDTENEGPTPIGTPREETVAPVETPTADGG